MLYSPLPSLVGDLPKLNAEVMKERDVSGDVPPPVLEVDGTAAGKAAVLFDERPAALAVQHHHSVQLLRLLPLPRVAHPAPVEAVTSRRRRLEEPRLAVAVVALAPLGRQRQSVSGTGAPRLGQRRSCDRQT